MEDAGVDSGPGAGGGARDGFDRSDRDFGTEFETGPGFTGSAEFGGAFGGTGAPGVGTGHDELVDIVGPPKEKGFWDRALDRAISMAIGFASNSIPGIGPVVGVAAPAVFDKIAGKTDEEVNARAGRGFFDAMTGGAFSTAAMFGEFAGKVAERAGAKGNPDVSFGQDAEKGRTDIEVGPGRGRGGEQTGDDAVSDTTGFTQTPGQPYVFSDGSTLIMDPKAVAAQQPQLVNLRQARPGESIGNRTEQIDELLRRARTGRIS